jgi:hypothetical protein
MKKTRFRTVNFFKIYAKYGLDSVPDLDPEVPQHCFLMFFSYVLASFLAADFSLFLGLGY